MRSSDDEIRGKRVRMAGEDATKCGCRELRCSLRGVGARDSGLGDLGDGQRQQALQLATVASEYHVPTPEPRAPGELPAACTLMPSCSIMWRWSSRVALAVSAAAAACWGVGA